MKTTYHINTAKNKQETELRGNALFPISIYQRDVNEYVGNQIALHWHHELELFVLQTGKVKINLIDHEIILEPGKGLFINSNVFHNIIPLAKSCKYRSIVFDSSIVAGKTDSIFEQRYLLPLTNSKVKSYLFDQTMIEHFHHAFDACCKQEEGYEFSVREHLSKILLSIIKQSKSLVKQPPTIQELHLKNMIIWLQEHYQEAITVNQLSKAMGICVRECQKIFASLLHTTPIQYLTRYRIIMACEFLLNSNHSISEIAYDCGFDNPSYFSLQFKKITNMTPKVYRNLHQVNKL